jgi:hypothetical protein
MATVLLDHPLLLAVSLFEFLMSVVETGFRLAVLTGANLDLRSLERLERNLRSLPPASPNTQPASRRSRTNRFVAGLISAKVSLNFSCVSRHSALWRV